MVAVFLFVFVLVDKNAYYVGFVIVLVDKIVWLRDFASVTVGSFVYQLRFVGKFLQCEMFEFVGVFVYGIFGYMVQKKLVWK